MAPKESMPQVHPRRSSLFSCSRSSKIEGPVSKPSSGRKGLWFLWRKFQTKNEIVPVDASSSEMAIRECKHSHQKSSSKKIRKDKVSKWLKKILHQKNQNQRQGEAPSEAKPRCHLASRYSSHPQPVPLLCVRDQERTGKTTIHLGLPDAFREPSRMPSKKWAETTRLSVLAVALVMTTLFGRASAIVCVCAWFYLLPQLRTAMAAVTRVDAGATKSGTGTQEDGAIGRLVGERARRLDQWGKHWLDQIDASLDWASAARYAAKIAMPLCSFVRFCVRVVL